jgi:predicted DCC family thiol-disulfide oxidoreductase YuxK
MGSPFHPAPGGPSAPKGSDGGPSPNSDPVVASGLSSPVESSDPSPVVLFDGVCNLCNSSVQFILKRDKAARFRFASLQGPAGQGLLEKFHLPENYLNSFVLIEGERVYTRSSAALRVLKNLGKGWNFFYWGGWVIPVFIRDAVYNWIARNRYRWFGRRGSCWVPTPELRARFLD